MKKINLFKAALGVIVVGGALAFTPADPNVTNITINGGSSCTPLARPASCNLSSANICTQFTALGFDNQTYYQPNALGTCAVVYKKP